MGFDPVTIGIVSAVAQGANTIHQNQLKYDEKARLKGEEDKAKEQLAAKQAQLEQDYKHTIDELNRQYDAALSDTDPITGQPTDLKMHIDKIVNNFQNVAGLAIKQWASSRGLGGSSVEGTKVAESGVLAAQKGEEYRTEVHKNLFAEKEQLADKAKTAYDMGLELPTLNYKQAVSDYKSGADAGFKTGADDWSSTINNLLQISNILKSNKNTTTTGNAVEDKGITMARDQDVADQPSK